MAAWVVAGTAVEELAVADWAGVVRAAVVMGLGEETMDVVVC